MEEEYKIPSRVNVMINWIEYNYHQVSLKECESTAIEFADTIDKLTNTTVHKKTFPGAFYNKRPAYIIAVYDNIYIPDTNTFFVMIEGPFKVYREILSILSDDPHIKDISYMHRGNNPLFSNIKIHVSLNGCNPDTSIISKDRSIFQLVLYHTILQPYTNGLFYETLKDDTSSLYKEAKKFFYKDENADEYFKISKPSLDKEDKHTAHIYLDMPSQYKSTLGKIMEDGLRNKLYVDFEILYDYKVI